MYKHILVPVDGSATSARGLKEAIKLAKDQSAKLRLIHVVNELVVIAAYETTVYSPELLMALREGGAKILAAAGQVAIAAGVATSTAVGSGRRSARIYRANILKMLLKIMDGYVKLPAVKP